MISETESLRIWERPKGWMPVSSLSLQDISEDLRIHVALLSLINTFICSCISEPADCAYQTSDASVRSSGAGRQRKMLPGFSDCFIWTIAYFFFKAGEFDETGF